jgi:hypothetical protein
MSDHRIARATPHLDHTVDIEWTDGTRSVADFKPYLARGGIFAELKDTLIFTHCMYVHWQGESLAWEVFGKVADFHADNLWSESRARREAAE